MKKLYFAMNDSRLQKVALFATGVTATRWQSTPAELLDLAARLREVAAAAPIEGKVTVVTSCQTEEDRFEPVTVVFASPAEVFSKAAKVAELAAAERLRSTMSLFADMVDSSEPAYISTTVKWGGRD